MEDQSAPGILLKDQPNCASPVSTPFFNLMQSLFYSISRYTSAAGLDGTSPSNSSGF